MKRLFRLTLIFLVMGLLLYGCSSGGGDVTSTGATSTPKIWGTAELIETDDTGDAYYPQIAFDGNGNAMAVWQQYDGTVISIWANRYDAASDTWGTAELIETNNTGDAHYPQIAFDGDGNAMAVWRQSNGTIYSIWANRYDAASDTWGTAELIETDDAGSAHYPQIAFDGDGNAISVWYQYDGSVYNIYANRYDAASDTWGTAELIETDSTHDALYAQIAVDGNGNAMAVWRQSDGTIYNIWVNRYDDGSNAWGTAELIETNTGSAYDPQIACDGDGNAIAVWHQYDGSIYNIWANRYDAASDTWDTAMLIETDTGDAYYAQIAFDDDGNAVAVWEQNDGSVYSIYANRYDAASDAWGTVELIETDTGDAYEPQIAVDGDGNAVAVWYQNDGSILSIWVNRYDAASDAWGTAELIETDDTNNAINPQIAVDGDGNAVAVWSQADGSVYNIWANRYE